METLLSEEEQGQDKHEIEDIDDLWGGRGRALSGENTQVDSTGRVG